MSVAFRLALPGPRDQKGLPGRKAHKDPLARPALKAQQAPRAQLDYRSRRVHRDRRGTRDRRDRPELEWLLRFPRTPLLAIRRSIRIRAHLTPQRDTIRSFPIPVPRRTPPRALRRSEVIQPAS